MAPRTKPNTKQKGTATVREHTLRRRRSAKCAICYDDLHTKTTVTFDDCHHVFHRSCAVQLLETEIEGREEPTCPLCRTVINKINLGGGLVISTEVFQCFGETKIPTKYLVFKHVWSSDLTIEQVLPILIERSRFIKKEFICEYYASGITRAMKTHCKRQISKMKKRIKILRQMHEVVKAGGMQWKAFSCVQFHQMLYYVHSKFNYELEMNRRNIINKLRKRN
ncbi:hypothetical protein PRIPAC_95707 [Pristionchus pacificus]|uniref:Zinc finger protein n=1 Tax=Pristionchus pacificus TaxID=54126 RepID=A0A2A6D2Y1_PRIPA|nr:hypothetical protein PRIPAC_95707 [Pristionchus pacificus]|eukprot:PDM84667.1 zinc finger protein [Pristionchus pacificus]